MGPRRPALRPSVGQLRQTTSPGSCKFRYNAAIARRLRQGYSPQLSQINAELFVGGAIARGTPTIRFCATDLHLRESASSADPPIIAKNHGKSKSDTRPVSYCLTNEPDISPDSAPKPRPRSPNPWIGRHLVRMSRVYAVFPPRSISPPASAKIASIHYLQIPRKKTGGDS